jgi:hypothetical protein
MGVIVRACVPGGAPVHDVKPDDRHTTRAVFRRVTHQLHGVINGSFLDRTWR